MFVEQRCQPQPHERQDDQADDQIEPVPWRGRQRIADRILQLVGHLGGNRAARAASDIGEGDIIGVSAVLMDTLDTIRSPLLSIPLFVWTT